MANIDCTQCGATVNEFDTYFTGNGQVCRTCQAAGEANAMEQRSMSERRANEANETVTRLNFNGLTFYRTARTEIDGAGKSVRTVSYSGGGIAGVVVQLVQALYSFFTRRPVQTP